MDAEKHDKTTQKSEKFEINYGIELNVRQTMAVRAHGLRSNCRQKSAHTRRERSQHGPRTYSTWTKTKHTITNKLAIIKVN